ncbi:transglutaminase family protein [Kushneria aurantia]|uniref:Transglutaminase N-terminal domain-containing protein n=1 Tax=Kushneria aurantia TaxID=504092 RepID=A0ABV6FYP4_9GAMM|nr:transglutaminase family protein [Kushneria aurantia]
MRYRVRHMTRYDYAAPVSLCHNEARLALRQLDWQQITGSRIDIVPRPAVRQQRPDFFGNGVTAFSIQKIHHSMTVTAVSEVETLPRPDPPESYRPTREAAVEEARHSPELRQFQLDSPFVARSDALRDFALPSFPPGRALFDAVCDLNRRIFEEFTYAPGFSTLATPIHEVLVERRGVCQDFAHLMIGALRSMGLAARYVSGYLETLPPPGQPRLVGADASHAWVALYLPGWGWLELDPTNGSLPGTRHLVLGWGRDYGDVPPLKGVMNGGSSHQLEVSVDVAPVEEG